MQSQKLEILFEDCSCIKLVGSNIKHFLIFSLKKQNNLSEHKTKFQDVYETFILVKATQTKVRQNNISFIRVKESQKLENKIQSQETYMKSDSYYSTFLRHVNLTYSRKLSELLQILNIGTNFHLQNQWLMLYQVHNFRPQLQHSEILRLGCPQYGSKVFVQVQDNKIYKQQSFQYQLRISNMFRYHTQNFYLMSDSQNPNLIKQLSILRSNSAQVVGVLYKLNETFLCIPFFSILHQKSCDTKILYQMFPRLYKTVYIQFQGSYCTGILISESRAISTRHILSQQSQKLSVQVQVRKFPYTQKLKGVVTKIGLGVFDFIQIQIFDTETIEKQKAVPSKSLERQLIGQNLKLENFRKNESNYKIKKNHQSYPLFKEKVQSTNIGQQILSLGFGKFSYNSGIFQKMQLVLPTIADGVISKKIGFDKSQVFLKTDAKLYSGFSGSGIWKNDVVGMAVFILRNKNNQSQYNRHNFSYLINFLKNIQRTQQKKIKLNFDSQIQQFDSVQTRKRFKFIELPKSKI